MLYVIIIVVAVIVSESAYPCQLLQQADELYARRASRFDTERVLADSTLADSCIALYRSALDQCHCERRPEIYCKLLQAYFFRGFYATVDKDRQKKVFEQAVEVGLRAMDEFPDSPGVNVWMATTWGLWAESHGSMSAATKGVADKIRRCCEHALEHDSTFCDAGALRILGGVNFKAPKIPLLLGWPSKKKAETCLTRALELAPNNLFNRRLMAEILYARKKRDRAREMMASIVTTDGIVHGLVEDTQIKKRAAEILAEWDAKDGPKGSFDPGHDLAGNPGGTGAGTASALRTRPHSVTSGR